MIFSNKIEDILSDIKKWDFVSGQAINIAEFLCGFEKNLSRDEKQIFAAVAVLVSEWTSSGSICLTKNVIEKFKSNEALSKIDPDWGKIKNVLSKSSCCTQDPEHDPKPLVLSNDKIYFYKYWLYENSLAEKVMDLSRGCGKYEQRADEIEVVFAKLFDEKSTEQQKAAENVIRHRFSVITGGPGTGKTTTVAKILAGILSVYNDERVILAAPTGKAAARMTEALKHSVNDENNNVKIDFKDVPENICSKILSLEGQTTHRILGKKFGKPGKNKENPIYADLIIVDEASMIDINMFSELLDALSEKTSLILLGDKDQLASIDVGNVLADICTNRALLPDGTVSELKTSHRFKHPGIGKLAKEVNEFDKNTTTENIIKICKEDPDLGFTTKTLKDIVTTATEKYGFLSETELTPEEILTNLNNFKILCPSKEDSLGVEKLNNAIEEELEKDNSGIYYNGRPIMITKNDYTSNLVNGDCGVILKRNGRTKAYFKDNSLSPFEISELPAFETVYAMTIHKSQGSEYNSVLIVLPEKEMPILTKELLYTAITRASDKVEISAEESILEYTLKNSAARNSGFEDALKKLNQTHEQ